MRMENPMRLRSRIKKVSEETGIPPDVTLHMYVMERFIARLAMSDYRDRFVLKGGFLLYARHGLRNRTTSDIDLTSKTESVEQEELREIIDEICSIDADDDLDISLKRMSPIAEVLEHPGIRAFLVARLPSRSTSTWMSSRPRSSSRTRLRNPSLRCSMTNRSR